MSVFVIASKVESDHEGSHHDVAHEIVAVCTSLGCAVEYILTYYVKEDNPKVKSDLLNNKSYVKRIDNLEFTYWIEKVPIYKMSSGYIEPV